jgi:predicted amidohydrolase
MNLKCTNVSYSLSEDPATLKEWREKLFREIQGFVSSGSQIILYPELFLMGLARYFKTSSPSEEIQAVSDFIAKDLLPELSGLLQGKDVLLVLGSGPREVSGKFFNSAPIWKSGPWLFQDKLFLTPWETDFTPGDSLRVFDFKGMKTAVVICFDSEQPDLALKLKEEGIDVVLVPSATTNRNGSQRVNRCASARAVELGAFVVTSPLVGDSSCDLVDHNEGRQGFFLPAQDDVQVEQETYSAYSAKESVTTHYTFSPELLKKLKAKTSETKPYHKATHSNLKLTRD